MLDAVACSRMRLGVIAHLLPNQAVALSKQGKLDEALARYDAAPELTPQLVAAWHNRRIDLMTAGRVRDALAGFDRAIDHARAR